MLFVLLLTLFGQDPSSSPAAVPDIAQLSLSTPRAVAEIDASKLQGDPVRLAWNADGSLYVRAAQTDRWGNERAKHYVIAGLGGAPSPTDGEPPWAAAYWLWKSSSSAPGVPDLRFDIETREGLKTAVGSDTDGGYSQSRANPNQPQIERDLASAQKVRTTTIKLKGELIVELVNAGFVPGLSFGWAPAPMGVLTFVNDKKRLIVIDRQGRKREVQGTVDVLLPAWSPDGKRIAYLQKKDKKKYALMTLDVVVGR